MKALALQSQQRTRRLALVIVVLVLLALPLLVYAVYADAHANALALAIDSPATLNDRIELASSVMGGKASGLGNPSGGSLASSVAVTTTQNFTYTVSPSSPNGLNGWYRSNVTVTWIWSDPQPPGTPPPCQPVYITQDQGPTTYNCTVGTTTIPTVPIKRDTKIDTPVITGVAGGKPIASGQWTNQNLTVTTNPPTNDLSGIMGCSPTKRDYTTPIVTTFTASCTDYAGNSSYPLGRFDVKIERTPPIFTGASQDPPKNSNGWNNTDVTVTWNWYEDPNASGIDSANCTQQLLASGQGTITLPTNGAPTCKDKAGNVGYGTQYTVKIDKIAPLYGNPTAIKTSDGSTYNTDTWTKSDVQVSFYCSDNDGGSGLATTSPVDKLISQEGANLTATAYDYECMDLAGNKASGGSTFGPIKIDKTKPKPPKYTVDPPPNAYKWNNDHVVTVTFASDGDDGVAQSGGVTCQGSRTLTQETAGTNVTGTCTDAVGWVSDPTTVTVKIDWTPPVYGPPNTNGVVAGSDGITAYSNGQPYTAGTWTKYPVEVWFQCSDNLSGPVVDPVKKTVSQEGANLSATATAAECKDYADNQVGGDRTFSPIKIDLTKPVIAGSRTPGPNNNGWNNTDVTVSFTCTDALSGPASGITNPFEVKTLSSDGLNQSVSNTASCVDAAGNGATPVRVGGINIDKTAPIITLLNPPGSYLIGCQTKPEYTVDASISGSAGDSVQGPTLVTAPNGSVVNRFTITAQDLAGNSATKVVDYPAYNINDPFWLSPIDPNGTSLFKLGNTIPIKFELYDCNGQPVTNADARLRVVYLGAGQQQADVNTDTKVAGGDSGNKFRRTGEYYQYNWSTKGITYTGDFKLTVLIGTAELRSVKIGLR